MNCSLVKYFVKEIYIRMLFGDRVIENIRLLVLFVFFLYLDRFGLGLREKIRALIKDNS